MKDIIYILALIILTNLTLGCTKLSPLEDEDDDDLIVNSDSSNVGGKEVIWTALLNPDTSFGINIDFQLTENSIINNYAKNVGYSISSYHKETGELNWTWSDLNTGHIANSSFSIENQVYIAINRTLLASISPVAGTTINKFSQAQGRSANPYGHILDDYFYYTRAEENRETAYLVRSNVNDLINWDTIYSLNYQDVNGSRPNIQSYNLYTDPISNEKLLVFQHRMSSPNRVDIVGYSLSRSEVIWKINDLVPSGISRSKQIEIYDENIFFQGLNSLYCINPKTGTIIWERNFINPTRQFADDNITLAGNNILIIKTDTEPILALDANTGNTIFETKTNTGYGSNEGDIYNGVYYYNAMGKLYAFDVSEKKVIWSSKSPKNSNFNFDGPIKIDHDRGILFASDHYYIYAINLKS